MTKDKVRKIVNEAWFDLQTMCNNHYASDLLRRAIAESERVERDHRRFVGPPSRYRSSVATSARYQVIWWVCQGTLCRRVGWLEAAETRRDIVICCGIHEKLRAARVSLAPLKQAAELDYVDDLVADPDA